MTFDVGRVVVRRQFQRDGLLSRVWAGRVAADDTCGLWLWIASGSDYRDIAAADGRAFREVPFGEWGATAKVLRELTWSGDMLALHPAGKAHSIWFFFEPDGAFRNWYVKLTRVVADDEQGLRLWMPAGSPYWRVVAADGRTRHDAPIDQLPGARLTRLTWTGSDVMIWMPAGQPYSVWWFWVDGFFDRWYVNMEEPYVRWADHGCAGVDTADQALDLVVGADRSWRRKDEEEFTARTGHPLYWTAAQALQIRATGERVATLAEAGGFPFDGTFP